MASSGERLSKLGGSRSRAVEEHRALLHRVLRSHEFEKSARLQEFLRCVCERAIQEPPTAIHEQEIGHRVFGRAADYDTSQDNIVRVTASQSRKKLESYFASGGASEPIILEIPKGHYTPIFRERGGEETSNTPEPQARNWSAIRRRTILILAASAPVLALIAAWCAWQLGSAQVAARPKTGSNPALHALWSQLLPNGGQTDIVVTDSSLSLFHELLDRQLTLAEYLRPDLWAQAGELSSNPALQAFARQAAQRGFTSIASVTFVYRIAQLGGNYGSRVSISTARGFNIRQMKSDNVILLGSSRANPWVELIQDRLKFHFGYDNKTRRSYFENLDPALGELKIYRMESGVSYCQIAFVPNLGGTGSILAISGTEVEGTEGGSEFVTDEHSLEQLNKFARPDHEGRFPYFEILLKSSRVAGVAAGVSVEAFRLVQPAAP